MKATIKDIARISGYSYATVARVLSGQSNVKSETKTKILNTMQELDYRPQLCQSIKEGISKTNVLVIVDDITNFFYGELIKNISETLQQHNYLVMIGSSCGDESIELRYLEQVAQANIAGVIMITVTDSERMRKLLVQMKIPVVLVNRYIRSIDLDVVCIDNLRGGYMAGEYLAGLGHSRICHLAGPAKSTASQDRTRGFGEAMKDAEIDFTASRDIFYGNLTHEDGYDFGRQFIEKEYQYTAIFCGNDIMARGFTEALKDGGISVPEDVSVIGFDNTKRSETGAVKLTTIWREPHVMGIMAATMMIERLTKERTEPFKMIYPPQLLIRDSCARPKDS